MKEKIEIKKWLGERQEKGGVERVKEIEKGKRTEKRAKKGPCPKRSTKSITRSIKNNSASVRSWNFS